MSDSELVTAVLDRLFIMPTSLTSGSFEGQSKD